MVLTNRMTETISKKDMTAHITISVHIPLSVQKWNARADDTAARIPASMSTISG